MKKPSSRLTVVKDETSSPPPFEVADMIKIVTKELRQAISNDWKIRQFVPRNEADVWTIEDAELDLQ